MNKKILVTGGAGYIGSHTILPLLENHFDIIVADNLSNSCIESLVRVAKIADLKLGSKRLQFKELDLCNFLHVDELLNQHSFDAVIHFAGLKAVGQSVKEPLAYYHNNVSGTLNLLTSMQKNAVNNLIFSSSATVYGIETKYPYIETQQKGTTSNPYGATKSIIERILEDATVANPDLSVISLRYFNPVGAHPSGLIGENPLDIPNNLLPFIAQVAVGLRPKLSVFGGDYPTEDGTCRRDYLHVMDLAAGHVKALQFAFGQKGYEVFNLGTGVPCSVIEMIKAFEAASQIKIPYEIVDRRDGDLAEFWANADKAAKVLGWKAKYSLNDMMLDTWRWQSRNPKGYSH